MTTPRGIAPLYRGAPYGVRALAYDTRDASTFDAAEAARGFDLAYRPRRQPLQLARRRVRRALDRRVRRRPAGVQELAGGRVAPVSRHAGGARRPDRAISSTARRRARTGRGLAAIRRRAVRCCRPRATPCCTSARARRSSSGTREKWRALAAHLEARGLHVVWSGGRGEEGEVAAIDPERRHAVVRRQARPGADVAPPQAGGAARLAGHRHRASRATSGHADGHAVRAGLSARVRGGRVLAR